MELPFTNLTMEEFAAALAKMPPPPTPDELQRREWEANRRLAELMKLEITI
jgi:hypothetical protein